MMNLSKNHTEMHLFHYLRTSNLSRIIACVVLTAFLGLVTQPAVAAVRNDVQRMKEERARAPGKDRLLAETLREARDTLRGAAEAARKGRDVAQERRQLAEQRKRLATLDGEVRAEFDATAALLAARKVPEVIRERHREAVAAYRQEMNGLLGELAGVEGARTPDERKARLEKAEQRLNRHKMERAPHPFDPNELPHRSQQPKPDNLPKTRKEEFTSAGLHDTPYAKLAALGDFKYDGLPGADDPAYLAATLEASFSDAVKAKAAELNHDPVTIYHWVRNTIEWLPTWGAVQDADLTLTARRGNALDIASLLIALLRASGIPARYVHGTVEVPEAQFRNWAGGFTHIAEAANYAASGGIPLTGLIEGGRIAKVRMEHIWVEAAIDYLPSRGAVNRSADSWLPLDASYKQYEFMEGLDVAQIANLDGEALANSFLQSGAVNEQDGWVQNLDATLLQNAQQEAQQRLEAHITQNMTDPTVGEVIGGRKVILREQPILPSGLPYRKVVEGARYGELPTKLRPTLTFGLGADLFGDPLAKKTLPWPQLNNRKVTLSFKPATADDEAALKALLPEGEITDLSQLPKSIPAYLIQVIPEVKVEGETVLTGSPMRLGEDLAFSYSVSDPIFGTKRYPNQVVAGSFLAIAVIGGSVAVGSLEEVKSKLNETKEKLQSEDVTRIAGLTREDLLGDMFHAGMLGYFAQYQALGHLSALSQKNHFQLATSAGTYGYVPNVTYFFGIPRSITPGGVEMDLDRVAIVTSVDGKGNEQSKNFTFQLGALSSALEHAVPEQMFVTPENPGEAVSAVKALQKAAQQGQRIYHITQANQATALPNIRQSSLTMSEIRAALAVGKEVIVHTDPVQVSGWKGAGYVITDPETGAGAWKIGGGANGGLLMLFIGALLLVLGLYFWAAAIGILLITYGAILMYMGLLIYLFSGGSMNVDVAAFVRIILLAIGVMLVPFASVPAVLLAMAITIVMWIAFSVWGSFASNGWMRYERRYA